MNTNTQTYEMNGHTLEVDLDDRDYVGNLTGICTSCFNPDWDGEGYVTGGPYSGRTYQDVEDVFHDSHL